MNKSQPIVDPQVEAPTGQPPSPNGSNGQRDANGRFAVGNKGGPGNPFAKQIAHVRALICEAVSEDDLREIIATMIRRAKEGDLASARELLDRLSGKPTVPMDEDRLALEERKLDLMEEKLY